MFITQQNKSKINRPGCVLEQTNTSYFHLYLSLAKLSIYFGTSILSLLAKRFCTYDTVQSKSISCHGLRCTRHTLYTLFGLKNNVLFFCNLNHVGRDNRILDRFVRVIELWSVTVTGLSYFRFYIGRLYSVGTGDNALKPWKRARI